MKDFFKVAFPVYLGTPNNNYEKWALNELKFKLEDLEGDDIALGPHLDVKTYDQFRLNVYFQPKPVTGFHLKVWSQCDVVVTKIF